ncbi:MAG: outer membrane protein transport protein [Tatlockia sp.]|nr:outer membrane protein transport protein [Tatlockia sp.]
MSVVLICFEKSANSAVSQLISNNFFQNPAELSQVKKMQLSMGNAFIRPSLKFTGITSLGYGKVKSQVNDSLPYLLTAYRPTNKVVIGLHITPSSYGHIDWRPHNSIVSQSSTTTILLYYRIGTQASYQISEKLALGMGFNVAYNKHCELDAIVPQFGNQINKISGLNHTFDAGLFFQFNPRNHLTVGVYTGVDRLGQGTSSLGMIKTHNLELLITEASVAYIGLQHSLSDKWFFEEKIYWSDWSIVKNVYFINKTNGTSIVPANWRDTWSYQVNTRFAISEKIALFGSIIYETNAAPISTNAIGYPLSALGSISGGLGFALSKSLSAQMTYSYGAFLPDAKINHDRNLGHISADFQTIALQLTYKI